MAWLPLANILHHKLRSALSALGIGIGICMVIALTGLASGILGEIADRWESVDADLIVYPRGWGENAADKSGSGLADRYAAKVATEHADIVERVVPVFTWPIKLGGQDQMVAGVDAADWSVLTGGRTLSSGRMYDPHGAFAAWIRDKLLSPSDPDELVEIQDADLAVEGRSGLEIVIDERLAEAGGYVLGQTVESANHRWKIVGIVPAGVMARVFMPRRTAQFLFGSGDITKSTLMFVKLKDGVDVGPAAREIAATIRQDVVPLDRYRGLMNERFGVMFVYIDIVNVVALTIAFLFIMVTLYTMVLQRTRDIAILKANGASNAFLVRQVLAESMLLTGAGTGVGIALSFLTRWLVETAKPLYTVTITWQWIGVATAAAILGATLSGLYPAWQATRVDMVEALTLE